MKQIKIGHNSFTYVWVTGKIIEVKEIAKTVGGGTIYVDPRVSTTSNINISSIIEQDVFLEDTAGQEYAIKLENFNFSCRAGHTITVIKIKKNNEQTGTYIGAFNHNTKEHKKKYYLFSSLTRPDSTTYWLMALCTPFALVFGFSIFHTQYHNMFGDYADLAQATSYLLIPALTILLWIIIYVKYQRKKRKYRNLLQKAYASIDISQ